MVGEGNRSSLLTHQLVPSRTPLSSPISHQPQLDIQDECLRTLTAHAVPPVETQVDGDSSDEVLAPPPNSPVAAYGSSGSTSIHVSDMKGGNWKNDAEVREVYEQATRKVGAAVGGEELTLALCAHPHPVQLISTQTEATGKLVTVPTRTLSPSSPSMIDTASDMSSSTHNSPYSPSVPACNLHHHSTSLHSNPPTPSFPGRRCSSLPPTLHQSKNCCGQQMLRLELDIPMIDNGSHLSLSTSLLTPPQTPLSISSCSETCQQQLDVQNTQDKQIRTDVLLLPVVPTVSKEDGLPSSMLDITPTDSGLYLAQIPLNHQPSDVAGRRCSPLTMETCSDKVFAPPDCTVAAQCACSSASTHAGYVGQGLLAQGQLGDLKDSVKVVGTSEQVAADVEVVDEGPGFTMAPSSPSSSSMVPESTSTTPSEISPMAQLMQEYSSAETGIMLVLSLGELTPDLIVERGKDGTRGLRHYHLVKATLDNICMVVMAQQTFVQRAAALMV